MSRTPRNLHNHELIGLETEVLDSSNPDQIGIQGRVVDETRETFTLETEDSEEKMIEKKGAEFGFELDDKTVKIDGDVLVKRPEERVKIKLNKW